MTDERKIELIWTGSHGWRCVQCNAVQLTDNLVGTHGMPIPCQRCGGLEFVAYVVVVPSVEIEKRRGELERQIRDEFCCVCVFIDERPGRCLRCRSSYTGSDRPVEFKHR